MIQRHVTRLLVTPPAAHVRPTRVRALACRRRGASDPTTLRDLQRAERDEDRPQRRSLKVLPACAAASSRAPVTVSVSQAALTSSAVIGAFMPVWRTESSDVSAGRLFSLVRSSFTAAAAAEPSGAEAAAGQRTRHDRRLQDDPSRRTLHPPARRYLHRRRDPRGSESAKSSRRREITRVIPPSPGLSRSQQLEPRARLTASPRVRAPGLRRTHRNSNGVEREDSLSAP